MAGPDDPFREVEELFDQLTAFGGMVGGDVPVDVVDADDELIVQAELPGRASEDIDVQLREDRRLTIEAGPPTSDAEGRYVSRERAEGPVSRTISLPAAVDQDGTSANYDRGVLTVRLAKFTGDENGTDIPVE